MNAQYIAVIQHCSVCGSSGISSVARSDMDNDVLCVFCYLWARGIIEKRCPICEERGTLAFREEARRAENELS